MKYDLLERHHAGLGGTKRGDRGHTTIYDTRLPCYFCELNDGGYVVDTKDLDLPFSVYWNMPMVDGSLAPEVVSPCPDIDPIVGRALMEDTGNPFGVMVAFRILDTTWRGLDSVSIEAYVALWQEHGARIGRRQGNEIVWNAELFPTPIVPEQERWRAEG